MTTGPTRTAATDDLTFGHIVVRWITVFCAAFATYGAGALLLGALNAAIWHYDGVGGDYGLPPAACLGVGVAGACAAGLLGRPYRVAWLPRRGWAVAWLVAGGLVLAYGALNSIGAHWYDLTFVAEGHVGASFAIIGVWLAWFILFPVGSLFVALGLGRR